MGTHSVPGRLRLDERESCLGIVLGDDPGAPPLESTTLSPRAALEEVIRESLTRAPCLVSFSGGRDSSTILALADHVARRDGLERPIPVTNRFPGVPEADESEWQELVVSHLGLEDWLKLELTDELDMIGPYASRMLLKHGPLFPDNVHFIAPQLERAAGGSLLTGFGGDELFSSPPRPALARLLAHRARPRRRELRQLALEVAPRAARMRAALARSPFDQLTWLRPHVRRELELAFIEESVCAPLRTDRRLERWWRSRTIQCATASMRALAADFGARVSSPFAHATVLSAYARAFGRFGYSPRTAALRELAGDVLPPALISRPTKASFDAPLWSTHSREFAQRWSGAGVDPERVSIDVLREQWSRPQPHPNCMFLVRSAWLADRAPAELAAARR